jgi:hypothetical protein
LGLTTTRVGNKPVRMDMHSRDQYLAQSRKDYIGASKAEKHRLLDEAEKRTELARKYLISRLKPEAAPKQRCKRSRKRVYRVEVKTALAHVWPIFDYACGQRLAPLLRNEVDRLRELGELGCSDAVAAKLKSVSPKTIDRLLAGERARLHLSRQRNPSIHPLLYQLIPVKASNEWDRAQLGNLQLDFVFHSGQSAAGHFGYTLSVADIASGWWEARAQLGRSRQATEQALEEIRRALPFAIREIHPDNDGCLINELIWNWACRHGIRMSRSRPLHKNDNAWVEQRNWSHVRKMIGYRRFDTPEQLNVLNELYADLVLYKNFFQPTMKLARKRRVQGKLHREYEPAITPFERLLQSGQLDPKAQAQLKRIHDSLNPAELKRRIDSRRDELMSTFENIVQRKHVPTRKMKPRLVRSFVTQQAMVRLDR